MKAPTRSDVEQILALAEAWRVSGERATQAQAGVEATKVQAEELRRRLEANRTLTDMSLNEFTRKQAEYEKLQAKVTSDGEVALAAGAGMQEASDALDRFLTSIRQGAVAEAPLGGFR